MGRVAMVRIAGSDSMSRVSLWLKQVINAGLSTLSSLCYDLAQDHIASSLLSVEVLGELGMY